MSPTSPFARKARIAVRELGLGGRVDEIAVDPWTDASLRALNPLSKIPVLMRDDGTIVFESLLVVEVLDALAGGALVPRSGPSRWDTLALHALAQGMTEATVGIVVERRRDAGPSPAAVARHEAAITAALAAAESGTRPGAFDVGAIGLACALGYLDLRLPELAWREGRPHLAAWLGALDARPSFDDTRPPG